MLELTVLAENSVRIISKLQGEHGLSIHLRCDGTDMLFDTGATDLYLQNASKLGVNLNALSWIIFSHHHYDHVNGLKYFRENQSKNVKVLAQKYAFYQRIDDPNDLSNPDILNRYEVVSVDSEPFEISDNLIFLARIPRLNDFECQNSFCGDKVLLPSGQIEDDFCFDDSALIYKSSDGVVVITGCSHSGICNIVRYAKQIAGEKWGVSAIKSVIGGLHLIDMPSSFLEKTSGLLKEYGVSEICPCHCTDLAAKIALAKAGFQVKEVNSGSAMKFQ